MERKQEESKQLCLPCRFLTRVEWPPSAPHHHQKRKAREFWHVWCAPSGTRRSGKVWDPDTGSQLG